MGLKKLLGFGERSHWKEEHILRSERTGVGLVRVGLIALVLVTVGSYLAFSKTVPWQRSFVLKGVFANAVNIRQSSPVRIAGVNVGRVSGAERDGKNLTEVTLKLEDGALPVKGDATMKIRPLLFLEGSYFVDLKPGSPSAPALKSGATVPVTQTATAVQFDEVLTALQADSRQSLRELLAGLASGLDSGGAASENSEKDTTTTSTATTTTSINEGAGQDDPEAAATGKQQPQSGAQALNQLYARLAPTLKSTAAATQAFLGLEPGDLSGAISGMAKTLAALDRNEEQLKDLVTNFNTTAAAFASESQALSTAIALLPGTLTNGRNLLVDLRASLPATRQFVRELTPGIEEIPETVDSSQEWLTQISLLLADTELGGLAEKLQPAVSNLAQLSASGTDLFKELDDLSQCSNKVLLPTADAKVSDPPHTTDAQIYKEFFYSLTGLGGAAQSFDGNGFVSKVDAHGGNATISLGKDSGGANVFANTSARTLPLGQRPQMETPVKRPPYRPQVACRTQSPPNLAAAQSGSPPSVAVTTSSTSGSTASGSATAADVDAGGLLGGEGK